MPNALLTFSIGPVHTFIAQARRVADLWAGSTILSTLTAAAAAVGSSRGDMVFPASSSEEGMPNRFVVRVPAGAADRIAGEMADAARNRWANMIDDACAVLSRTGIPAKRSREAEAAISCAWSWIPEGNDYAATAREAAERFAASRMYRPFAEANAEGLKCAVCGERTALPDGDAKTVGSAWKQADTNAKGTPLEPFFREDQGRLCLVCATKRLFPLTTDARTQTYRSFVDFQPAGGRPYFAIVSMDGDHLGEALRGDHPVAGLTLQQLQAKLSKALSEFAASLRSPGNSRLNVSITAQGMSPELIYAGGEDVLFLSDPRDALAAATAVQERYAATLRTNGLDPATFTISAAILLAHTKMPAGGLFRTVERILKERAKREAGRNAVAIALHKRSGQQVEVAFKWDDPLLLELKAIQANIGSKALSSRKTYMLVEESADVPLTDLNEWEIWLASRLSRGQVPEAADAAKQLAPFFPAKKTTALRIARFLAIETGDRG